MTLIKAIDLAITYMRCYQMALKLKRPDKHMSKRFLVTLSVWQVSHTINLN